jgi:NAD-dependent deacetylase
MPKGTSITPNDQEALAKAKDALLGARRVFVLTGAGIAAESGVPTFRGGGGAPIWRGMPFEELSSAQMVEKDLPLVWEWFDYRRCVVAECHPNVAHLALAAWEWSGRFDEFSLVTQNVDGLHAAAGSTDVIELHGNIWRARCLRCDGRREMRDIPTDERPPLCVECGEVMRPDVVLFGENLPTDAFNSARWYAETCDVCLVIGTSALVNPAARLPEIAGEAGKFIIEINPEKRAFSDRCNVSLRGLAGEILPHLLPTDGRELVLRIAWEGGDMRIYRNQTEKGGSRYRIEGSSMTINDEEEEGVATWESDAGNTLEEAIASLKMRGEETLIALSLIKILPECRQAVWDIINRLAKNAPQEFLKSDWTQRSLAKWREMTIGATPKEN